jgi:hypothetical protein
MHIEAVYIYLLKGRKRTVIDGTAFFEEIVNFSF